jgi:hypothetical protein
MQTERLRELASSRACAAREAAEEVQLVRSGQSLEGPETG